VTSHQSLNLLERLGSIIEMGRKERCTWSLLDYGETQMNG